MAAFFDDDDAPEASPEGFFTQTESQVRARKGKQRDRDEPERRPEGGSQRRRERMPQPDAYNHNDDDAPDARQEVEFEFEGQDDHNLGNVVQALTARWMNERSSPEILPNDPGGELEDCLQTLLRQQEAVNSLRSDMENWTEAEHLRLMLVQQDNERIRWLANSYLRCRLKKIEDHHLALLGDEEYRDRLSTEESQYLDRFDALKTAYFTTLCLNTLPQKLRSLADQPAMVHQPDMNQAVYIRALKTCGPIRTTAGKTMTLDKDSIHMLRYNVAKDLLSSGDVQLI